MREMLRAGYNSHSGFGLNIFSDDEAFIQCTWQPLKCLTPLALGYGMKSPRKFWRLSDVLLIKIRMRYAFLSTLWKMPFALHPHSVMFAGRNPKNDYVLQGKPRWVH